MTNNNDIRSREELRRLIQKAVKDNDAEAFQAAFDISIHAPRYG